MNEAQKSKLKKLRQEKGLSVEDMYKKTKIHVNVIKSLEGDSMSSLNPVYLKGFLKIYCNALGVDPKEFMDAGAVSQQPVVSRTKAEKQQSSSEETVPKPVLKLSNMNFNPTLYIKKFGFVFVGIVCIALAVVVIRFVAKKLSTASKKTQTVVTRQVIPAAKKEPVKAVAKTVVKSQETAASANQKVSKEPVAAVSKKETVTGIRLTIRAKENCWISLKVDGKVVFQRVLEKGRSETWQGKDKIELSVGSAGAVELEVNGQLFSNLGRRGEARKNILITKDGLSVNR